jgi:hypothetical protein
MAAYNNTESSTDHPLGLTVYDLPSPEKLPADDLKRTRVGRLRMMVVLLICAAPVIASYFTYYIIRPDIQKSHGQLIQPSRSLPAIQVLQPDGKPVQLSNLAGQWLLISVGSGQCDPACQQRLYLQRQILTGLGKERDRTEWVWLVNDDLPIAQSQMPGIKEATVLRIDAHALEQWLEPEKGHDISEHYYLVDPQGQWMMRFPANTNRESAPKVKRDIERLLRANAGWDQPGR